MCGRFVLTSSVKDIAKTFGMAAYLGKPIPERYNISPGQVVLIVRHDDIGRRVVAAVEWGLVPEWAKERNRDKPLINARLETITQKPSFRSPIKRTRCLVPANGWYEWPKNSYGNGAAGGKKPWFITFGADTPFAFAGIWTTWHGPDGESWLETMAIITLPCKGSLKTVHPRKPLVICAKDYAAWLEPHDPLPRNFLDGFSEPDESDFTWYRVSERVNSVYNDDAACMVPAIMERQGSLF